MKHIDLFSGIGGFSYAADQVWPDLEHIFCDIDPFCRAVTQKHWPGSTHYDDIRQLIADTANTGIKGMREREIATTHTVTNPTGQRLSSGSSDRETRQVLSTEIGTATENKQERDRRVNRTVPYDNTGVFLVTGGFPCQPFSQAGRRRGTADDRYLWPAMFRVIQLTSPEWVIAENVGGLVTWNDGMVLEQVCTDLESEGYEVQPFIIPAAAVNAPHRRDRVWIVANRKTGGLSKSGSTRTGRDRFTDKISNYAQDTIGKRGRGRNDGLKKSKGKRMETEVQDARSDWGQDWPEVATRLCGVDDGLPARVDGFEYSKPRHRKERLKALGNAIVPQVALEIMKTIAIVEGEKK